jgi:GNAT superfamily N-acetyltransferase
VEELTALSAPEPLASHHSVEHFHCGEPPLDEWLKRRALPNQASGASRTFVIQAQGRAIGYYALAAGSVARIDAPRTLRRNMPDPVPVVVVERLAIDSRWQRRGLGAALLKDALLRCLAAAAGVGIAAVLVHALSEDARAFYQRAGFVPSPIHPLTLLLPIRAIDATLAIR